MCNDRIVSWKDNSQWNVGNYQFHYYATRLSGLRQLAYHFQPIGSGLEGRVAKGLYREKIYTAAPIVSPNKLSTRRRPIENNQKHKYLFISRMGLQRHGKWVLDP